jgi:hypothetical protein
MTGYLLSAFDASLKRTLNLRHNLNVIWKPSAVLPLNSPLTRTRRSVEVAAPLVATTIQPEPARRDTPQCKLHQVQEDRREAEILRLKRLASVSAWSIRGMVTGQFARGQTCVLARLGHASPLTHLHSSYFPHLLPAASISTPHDFTISPTASHVSKGDKTSEEGKRGERECAES